MPEKRLVAWSVRRSQLIFKTDPIILTLIITSEGVMEIVELDRLELQIERLLRNLEDLQAENKHLRSQIARHARDKSVQYQNNRQAAGKIRKIISHLQEALV